MHARDIATGAPTWVYVLLAALVLLGTRRLKTRETPLVVALIPSAAFLIWSLVGASAFAGHAEVELAVSAWWRERLWAGRAACSCRSQAASALRTDGYGSRDRGFR